MDREEEALGQQIGRSAKHTQALAKHTEGPFNLFFEVCEYENMHKDTQVERVLKKYAIWKRLPKEKKKSLAKIFESQFKPHTNTGFHEAYMRSAERVKNSPYRLWLGSRLQSNPTLMEGKTPIEVAIEQGDVWNRLPIDEKTKWISIFRKRAPLLPGRKRNGAIIPTLFYFQED